MCDPSTRGENCVCEAFQACTKCSFFPASPWAHDHVCVTIDIYLRVFPLKPGVDTSQPYVPATGSHGLIVLHADLGDFRPEAQIV